MGITSGKIPVQIGTVISVQNVKDIKLTNMDEIIDLISNCGFVLEFRNDAERKARFRNDETFIDVWYGKKRKIVLGIYNPEKKRVKYQWPVNLIDLEIIVLNYEKYN